MAGATLLRSTARAQQSTRPTIGYLQLRMRLASKTATFAAVSPTWDRSKTFRTFRVLNKQLLRAGGHSGSATDNSPPRTLVRRRVNVHHLRGRSTSSAAAAKAATKTIAIIFNSGGDPVRSGLVPNFNHPGGNITGVTVFAAAALTAKRVEAARRVAASGKAHRSAIRFGIAASNPLAEAVATDARGAAKALGHDVYVERGGNEVVRYWLSGAETGWLQFLCPGWW